jgi:hypothetical protein
MVTSRVLVPGLYGSICAMKLFILIVLFLVLAVIQLDVGISEEETVIFYHRPYVFLKLCTLMGSD